MGKTHGVPGLDARVAFDNERRWLSFDLLCGCIGPAHPLWSYLRGAGATLSELARFRAHACPPDILGVDHYDGERGLWHLATAGATTWAEIVQRTSRPTLTR